MPSDDAPSRDDLERMLAATAPSWRLRTATPAAAGHHPVYRLAVQTPAGDRTCYLKATPPGQEPTVDLEARVLAAIDAHTAIPVPTVLGAVDDHDRLPAPFVLTSTMPGSAVPRTALATLPAAERERIARTVGRYLADLHALDAVDAFGFLTWEGPTLGGGRPSGDLALAVADPVEDWHARLRDWAAGTLDDLGATRFADVVPRVDPVLETRIAGVEGPFAPALARIDQSLDNLLLRDGTPTALLDWEFTIAATPAYDCCCVAWSLAGGLRLFSPDVPDRRRTVGEALLAGYGERGDRRVLAQVRANRACYDLLATLRAMAHLTDWYRLFGLEDRIDDAAAALRGELARRV